MATHLARDAAKKLLRRQETLIEWTMPTTAPVTAPVMEKTSQGRRTASQGASYLWSGHSGRHDDKRNGES